MKLRSSATLPRQSESARDQGLAVWVLFSGIVVGCANSAFADLTKGHERKSRPHGERFCLVEALYALDKAGGAPLPHFRKASNQFTYEDQLGPPITEIILQKGRPLTRDELVQARVPSELVDHYDLATGRLNYKPNAPQRLAVENGRQPIAQIRMNWTGEGKIPFLMSRNYLRQISEVLQRNPRMTLLITAPGDAGLASIKKLDRELEKIPKSVRSRIQRVNHTDDPNPWAQDGSKPLNTGREVLLPYGFQNDSGKFPHELARDFVKIRKSPIRFEGGNIVVGDRHVFVGSDLVSANAGRLRISRENMLEVLSKEFGMPAVELGLEPPHTKYNQVDYHLDLTMAVAIDHRTGTEVILLDSLDLALDLIEKSPDWKTLTADERRHVLAGFERRPLTRGERRLVGSVIDIKNPDTSATLPLSERKAGLKKIKSELKALGYAVIDVPGYNQNGQFFSYVNALFSNKTAITSHTGVEVWDSYVQKQFKELGYEVHQLPVAQESLCQWGGIRCLTEAYRTPAK